jgi:hypothetical protein
MKHMMMVAVCMMVVVGGCGMLATKQAVPKEQMDKDIATQVVDVQEGIEKKWIFEADDQRCFSVIDAESQSTDSSADVVVNVGSWQEFALGGKTTYLTVFGKMVMKYKKDNGKWVLDKIEPKDLISKNLEMDQFKKWLDIQTPLCKYSRFVK